MVNNAGYEVEGAKATRAQFEVNAIGRPTSIVGLR
ncbi:hypothetical protein J2Z30_007190 [Streptomyces iranensis]|uniref:Short-chain dehydrogenase/reductase SDR n=1 Tax=Streptomyces iranensis TaxID=576784 RepID=A0ABS4N2C3_9ACTN|nr:hypothetical protein [Streptomyces iranensis]